jgi:hypothetical protein
VPTSCGEKEHVSWCHDCMCKLCITKQWVAIKVWMLYTYITHIPSCCTFRTTCLVSFHNVQLGCLVMII